VGHGFAVAFQNSRCNKKIRPENNAKRETVEFEIFRVWYLCARSKDGRNEEY
jgi:hypothetical protein